MNRKVEAYIGFAIKKRSVLFGLDTIEASRRKVFLILQSNSISDNSLRKTIIVGQRRNCLVKTIEQLENIANHNCKVLGICDKQLADAIINNLL